MSHRRTEIVKSRLITVALLGIFVKVRKSASVLATKKNASITKHKKVYGKVETGSRNIYGTIFADPTLRETHAFPALSRHWLFFLPRQSPLPAGNWKLSIIACGSRFKHRLFENTRLENIFKLNVKSGYEMNNTIDIKL